MGPALRLPHSDDVVVLRAIGSKCYTAELFTANVAQLVS